MKHRTLLGIFCVIMALVVVFVISPLVTQVMNGRVSIVRAKTFVEKGSMLTSDDFEVVSVGAYNIPDNVVKNINTVIGKFAAVDIVAGSYLLPEMVTGESIKASDVIAKLGDGEYAITIAFPTFAAGFAGELQNGDIIRLLAYDNASKNTIELNGFRYTQIITTVIGNGLNKDELVPNEDGSYTLPSAVMLRVNEEQSKLIVKYTNLYGNLHMVFICHGDDERAAGYLEEQKKYFESESTETVDETTGPVVIENGPED